MNAFCIRRSPDGRTILYAAPLQGVTFPLKAITPEKKAVPVPPFGVTGEGNRYRFMPDGKGVVALQGRFRHQDFFYVDLATGERRQLTHLEARLHAAQFRHLPGRQAIVFDRVQENSDIVLIDLPRRTP